MSLASTRASLGRLPGPAASIATASPLLFVPIGRDRSPYDLLHAEPIERLDLEAAREALTFAFASGDGDVFARLLDHTPVAPSDFVAEDFAVDLELDRFVERCLPVMAGGARRPASVRYLTRVLASPPRERAHVEFRQGICAELASSPALSARLEGLYSKLVQLRTRLQRPSVGLRDGVERRLGILHALREVLDSLASDLAGTTSGLARLHRRGQQLAQGPAYRRLCELLAYEERRAELTLRVAVGFDGRIRTFELLEQREDRSNAFYSSAAGRLWASLLLLLGGFHFGNGEVLSRLVDGVFALFEPEVVYFFQLIGDLEVYLAALGFRQMAAGAGFPVCLAELDDDRPRTLSGLFNPWLVAEGRPCTPAELELGVGEHLVLLTGPNSGGKTRLLQTLALCQLLAQAGLFVPAARAELCWRRGLFVSLGEPSRADQAEGRLGMELLRVRRLFEHLRVGSLVVLDELCSGTNPSEGEALMLVVIEELLVLRPHAFITTHFLQLAARLAAGPARHRFLQTELGADHEPTFRFVDGVAETSLARRVAERLGVTPRALRALVLRNNPELAARFSGPR